MPGMFKQETRIQFVVNMSQPWTGFKPWKALCAIVRTFTLFLDEMKNNGKTPGRGNRS